MSTYTNLGLEKMVDGDKANTWGQVTNTNWDITEDTLTGKFSIALSDQDYTVASYNNNAVGSGNETRRFYLEFTGALTADRTVTLPTKDKVYGLKNSTSGGFSLVFSCGSGSNVTITNGKSGIVHTSITGQNVTNLTDVPTDTSVSTAISKIPASWTNSDQSILGLTDTPNSIGTQGQVLKVNSGGTALEFADDSSGSAGISLADARNGLSVTSLNPSGGQNSQLAYSSSTGQFTFVPPDLSGYATTGQLSGVASASATPGNYVANLNFNQANPTVGSMVFAAVSPASTTTYSYGSTISGGNLLPTGAITTWGTSVTNQAMNSSSAMSGTWRCLGQRQPHPSNTFAWTINMATLWIRTS